jgi:hypothetical protein
MTPTTPLPQLAAAARRGPAWPWPLPALLAWLLGWGLWLAAQALGAPATLAWLAALAGSLALAWRCQGVWRRLLAALGFPLSAWALVPTGDWPSWLWLLMVLPLMAAYPPRAWRDAPLFPTPAGALAGLDRFVPAPASVLDAGCGLGHGLAALHAVWPQTRLHGVEWSRPAGPLGGLALQGRVYPACRHVGRFLGRARSGLPLPAPREHAARLGQGQAEMRPGAGWSAWSSLCRVRPEVACLKAAGRRPVWVYACPCRRPTEGSTGGRRADNPPQAPRRLRPGGVPSGNSARTPPCSSSSAGS